MVKLIMSTYSEKLDVSFIATNPSSSPVDYRNNLDFNNINIPVYTDEGLSEYQNVDEIFGNQPTPSSDSVTDTFYQHTVPSNLAEPTIPNIVLPYNSPPVPTPTPYRADSYTSYDGLTPQNINVFQPMQDFMSFISTIKSEGFFVALLGKPLDVVLMDGFYACIKAVGLFVTGNGDIFFLMPSIAFMFATFLVGRNRFTKWIVPLFFTYAVSRVAFKIILSLT